jgi:hypothetical protein
MLKIQFELIKTISYLKVTVDIKYIFDWYVKNTSPNYKNPRFEKIGHF